MLSPSALTRVSATRRAQGWRLVELEGLPAGPALLLREALQRCRADPPPGAPLAGPGARRLGLLVWRQAAAGAASPGAGLTGQRAGHVGRTAGRTESGGGRERARDAMPLEQQLHWSLPLAAMCEPGARAARLARGGIRPGGPRGHGGGSGGGGGRSRACRARRRARSRAAGPGHAAGRRGRRLAAGARAGPPKRSRRLAPAAHAPAAHARRRCAGPWSRSVTNPCAGLGCSSASRPAATGVRSIECARPSAAQARRRPLSHRSAPAAHRSALGQRARRDHPGARVHAGAQPSRSRLSIGGGPEAAPPPLLSYRAAAPAAAAPPPAWALPAPEDADAGAGPDPGAPAPPAERPGSAAAAAATAAPGPPPRLSALALPHTQRLLSPGALPRPCPGPLRPYPGPTQARRAPPWLLGRPALRQACAHEHAAPAQPGARQFSNLPADRLAGPSVVTPRRGMQRRPRQARSAVRALCLGRAAVRAVSSACPRATDQSVPGLQHTAAQPGAGCGGPERDAAHAARGPQAAPARTRHGAAGGAPRPIRRARAQACRGARRWARPRAASACAARRRRTASRASPTALPSCASGATCASSRRAPRPEQAPLPYPGLTHGAAKLRFGRALRLVEARAPRPAGAPHQADAPETCAGIGIGAPCRTQGFAGLGRAAVPRQPRCRQPAALWHMRFP
jgi:hypothetical protein